MASDSPHDQPVTGISETRGALVVRLTGELDLYNAPVLREALLECASRTPRLLVLDLAEVTFVDSTVLGVFVEVRSKVGSRDGLVLAAPGLEARRALEVSGLDRHFSVTETVEGALGG
jgi:anti-sigma B factor antagonist